ncbi:MAG TPA: hypothetical protein VMN76_03600 [Acidobacteriota bacterium]|nr:hypothetical protein [Acidobacteriota bacterium]
MAVYRRRYRRYKGELTSRLRRIQAIPRTAIRRVFQMRIFLAFFLLCLIAPIGAGFLIYLTHNLTLLDTFGVKASDLVAIDASFFLRILSIQGTFAFLLTVFVGPGLISPDLVNNGLPLYLCRLRRFEYVAGKMSILVVLLSLITWIPLTLLYLLQAGFAGGGWLLENSRIAMAGFAGSLVWIVLLSLLALSVSAWVRWKAVAGAAIFGSLLVGAGAGEAINALFFTRWGDLLQLNRVIDTIWVHLFFPFGEAPFRFALLAPEIPVSAAWIAVFLVSAFFLLLLGRKLRAYEVVR